MTDSTSPPSTPLSRANNPRKPLSPPPVITLHYDISPPGPRIKHDDIQLLSTFASPSTPTRPHDIPPPEPLLRAYSRYPQTWEARQREKARAWRRIEARAEARKGREQSRQEWAIVHAKLHEFEARQRALCEKLRKIEQGLKEVRRRCEDWRPRMEALTAVVDELVAAQSGEV